MSCSHGKNCVFFVGVAIREEVDGRPSEARGDSTRQVPGGGGRPVGHGRKHVGVRGEEVVSGTDGNVFGRG